MKLYTKGDRRYQEAKPSDVLFAASEILSSMKGSKAISTISAQIFGIASVMQHEEETEIIRAAKTAQAQKEKPL